MYSLKSNAVYAHSLNSLNLNNLQEHCVYEQVASASQSIKLYCVYRMYSSLELTYACTIRRRRHTIWHLQQLSDEVCSYLHLFAHVRLLTHMPNLETVRAQIREACTSYPASTS
jgi:hypothetical protein